MPDADGFYAPERTHLGLARWTSWQARKRLRVRWNRAKISLTTHRPTSAGRTDHAFIVTPWQTLKVPLQPGVWRGVELKVPRDVKLDTLEVEIVTFDHWFPVEELGVDDQRCLGVLVREDRGIRDWTPVWRGSVPIDPQEAARLAEFRFENPPPLVDW
jgi:hypothetical protein